MGLFEKIFRPKQAQWARESHDYFKTLTAYSPHFTTWNGSIYESELVRSAIDARARHISKLKVEIIGTAQRSLQARLRIRPNNFMTWSQFLYRCSTILDMENTLVICKIFDEYMDTVGIYPLLPKRCEVIEFNNEPWLRYEFKDGQKAVTRLSDCAILTKFQYKSDFFGEDNRALDPTMKLIHLQNEGIEEAVKNGVSLRFIAKVSNFSLPSDLAKEQKRFTEAHFRGDDSGILLFPNTYNDIRQIDSNPYTVSESEQESIRRAVYNYFGVNEDVLQSKAYGDAWSAFYESVIEQFAIQFSEALTSALFTDREIASGTYVMATSNRLQYMSTADKLNVSSQMADRGILTLNEVREIWNLPSIDGGDVRIVRGEYYNADQKMIADAEAFNDTAEEQEEEETNADQEG